MQFLSAIMLQNYSQNQGKNIDESKAVRGKYSMYRKEMSA